VRTLEAQTHIKLWMPDFWRMSISNLLLSMAVYMLFPVLPLWIEEKSSCASLPSIGGTMALFGVGLFVLGPFYGYLADAFKRKTICLLAIVTVALASAGYTLFTGLALLALIRMLQGTAFGIAQMSLGSTLALDLTNTKRRTEAGYSYYWFGRLALSLGPLLGIFINHYWGSQNVLLSSSLLTCLSLIFVLRLKVPFRAPLNPKTISCDRFWLPKGKWLFLNFFCVSLCLGLLLSVNLSFSFYGFIMVGFLVSLIAQRVVFVTADLKSEVVSGLLLIGAAMLLHITHNASLVTYGASVMIGLGIGLVSSHFFLYFIKVSEHCQRSTAQSTYMLCWESGLAFGFALGLCMPKGNSSSIYLTGLTLCIIALVMYLTFTYKWVMANRLR
jgi:MFS family permease